MRTGQGVTGRLSRLKLGPERRRFGDGEDGSKKIQSKQGQDTEGARSSGSQTFRAERWERRSVCMSLSTRGQPDSMWAVSVWLRGLDFLPIALQSFVICALARPGQRSEIAGKARQERLAAERREEKQTVRYERTSSPLAPVMGKTMAETQGEMERDTSVAATSGPAPFDHNSPVPSGPVKAVTKLTPTPVTHPCRHLPPVPPTPTFIIWQ